MHHKHPKLTRPALGNYARTEFALVGSTCARMEAIMRDWVRLLTGYRTLLVTGEHTQSAVPTSLRYDRKHFTTQATDWNDFDDRLLGSQYDLALTNGNHYPATRQIVFVDQAKAGTLVRRQAELSNVFAVVFVDADRKLPDWLADHLADRPQPPVSLGIDEVDRLLPLIEQALVANRPPLEALILAGGQSTRMGTDKAELVYRDGQTEVQRLHHLCAAAGLPVSLSVRSSNDTSADLPLIEDRFVGLGPAGAICSAFLTRPDSAWLVLACDLPLLDADTLQTLIDARRADRVATAVRGPGKEWPEPLIAIYEPRAYPRLLQFLGLGYSCPRKLLINSDVEVVGLADGAAITNANTPGERAAVRVLLGAGGEGK